LRVIGKAVLLHPLSERTRVQEEGNRKRKFFESLRPAQASEEDAINRNLVRKTGAVMRREAEPEIQRKTKAKTIVQRRV